MTASTQSYCTGEQCSLPSCLPACQPANHRYGNLYHQRQCFHLQGGWDAWPVAAVALLHAPIRLFRQHWPFGWWRCLRATWCVRPLTSCSCTATCGPPSRPLSQKPRTLVCLDVVDMPERTSSFHHSSRTGQKGKGCHCQPVVNSAGPGGWSRDLAVRRRC